jgi:hypothetical protein
MWINPVLVSQNLDRINHLHLVCASLAVTYPSSFSACDRRCIDGAHDLPDTLRTRIYRLSVLAARKAAIPDTAKISVLRAGCNVKKLTKKFHARNSKEASLGGNGSNLYRIVNIQLTSSVEGKKKSSNV